MNAARHLYIYGVSAISLLVLAFAVTNLVTLTITRILFAVSDSGVLATDDALRRSATFSVALVLVTLPVWTLHWWLGERGAKNSDDDRTSLIRTSFLLSVIAIALIVLAVRAIDLTDALVAALISDNIDISDRVHLTRTLTSIVVVGSILAYHTSVRQRDVAHTVLTGASDWLGRLVNHVATLSGVWMLLVGVAGLLAVLVNIASQRESFVESRPWVDPVASGIGLTLTGLAIWSVTWIYGLRRLDASGWASVRWRESDIRRVYLAIITTASALVTMVLVSRTAAGFVARLVVDSSDELRDVEAIATYGLRSLPFLIAAVYHSRRFRWETATYASEPARTGVPRTITYSLALLGVGFTWFGLAGFVSLGIDAIDTSSSDVIAVGTEWRIDLARLVGVTLTGTLVWLWHWYRVLNLVSSSPEQERLPGAERNALSRRVYLLAISGSGVVAIFLSLASLVYWLLVSMLDVSGGNRLDVELSGPLALVIVTTPLLLYHLAVLRADSAGRPDVLQQPDAPLARASLQLVLTGPSAHDVHAAATSLSASMPDGYTLSMDEVARS